MWKLSESDDLNWNPGNEGKGLVMADGSVITWNTDERGGPIHTEYTGVHGLDWDNVMQAFDIEPDGTISTFLKDDLGPEARQHIHDADVRLNASDAASDQWSFTAADEGDMLDWDEGNSGKGIIDRNGHVYTWNDVDYEVHHHFLQDHPEILPQRYFWIEPDGQCRGAGLGDELTESDEEILREADPRLYVKHEEESTWSFEPATM